MKKEKEANEKRENKRKEKSEIIHSQKQKEVLKIIRKIKTQ